MSERQRNLRKRQIHKAILAAVDEEKEYGGLSRSQLECRAHLWLFDHILGAKEIFPETTEGCGEIYREIDILLGYAP